MSDPMKEMERYHDATRTIIDGRDPVTDMAAVMVTLEGAVAATLLMVMNGDHRKAVGMLNEGLVPGVEHRIALSASRTGAA
ncbi:hypothetical protein [Oceaniglobus ichthyenteri]|uniref:hypothetical protein n=1 Tax=Oceaniglobus ichthyenteri TaxID=2136177 RepID=UPI000D3C3794|nr:hypothetical protein [Oceaniglobus ichthyenteri]